MSYARDREAFVYRMAKRGMDLYDIRLLLSNAGTLQRAAEVDCSVPGETLRVAAEANAKRATRNVREVLQGSGWRPMFGGDPRGYVLHLLHPDHNEDAVPAEGYRASQMARMAR